MSVPDKAMKLKDGKIIADQLSSMIAVQFVQGTANAAGSYVVYNGEVFYLPDGHTAGTTWANTTKEGPTNIGEINTQLKDKIDQEMNKSRPLPLSKSSVSSLPTTITDSRITATMICPPGGMRLSSPSAQGGDWTISTAAGSVTISGTIRGTTTIYLWLEEPMT